MAEEEKGKKRGREGVARVQGEPTKSQSPYYYGQKPNRIVKERHCKKCGHLLCTYNLGDECFSHSKGQTFFAESHGVHFSSGSRAVKPGIRHTGSRNE